MTDILIKHGYVVTMDPERRILSDGAVAIAGNRIEAIGPTREIAEKYKAPTTIDATDKMVIPGLIDGHNHPFAYLVGGMADEVDIFTTLYKYFYPYEVHVTPEQARTCALGNYLEMIKNGTTCFVDPGGYHVDHVAQAAVDSGIRGILARSTRDTAPPGWELPPALHEDLETNLREGEKVVQRWNGAAERPDPGMVRTSATFSTSATKLAIGNSRPSLASTRSESITHVAAVKGEKREDPGNLRQALS